MQWKKLVQRRRQEILFDKDEIIDRDILSEVLHMMHRQMPSKQGQFPFDIDVLDWSNNSLRNYLIKNTVASDGRMNMQMLAPILLCFSTKDDSGSEMEIGIASMFLSLALKDIGLNSGFCACIQNNDKIASKLKRGKESSTVLFLGVGKNVERNKQVTDIVSGETYITGPNRKERKRSFVNIVKFHF